MCRAPIGSCDPAETCSGTSNQCPASLPFLPLNSPCRIAAGPCDLQENCTGVGAACPTDLFKTSTVTCRSAVGVCDLPEVCSGLAGTCPTDAFKTAAVACRPSSGVCDSAEACSGLDGDANCSESCNEAADSCNAPDPEGGPCVDTNACTSGDICAAGVCAGGAPAECDDGDICTTDACDETEGCTNLPEIQESGCLEAGKGQILLSKNNEEPGRNRLKWTWKKGAPVAAELLGAPLVDTEYALCLFDRYGGEPILIGSYRLPAAAQGWTQKPTIVAFANLTQPPDGINKLTVKSASEPGKASAVVTAGGSSLRLFEPVGSNLYVYHEPSLVAQLRNTRGACWTTEFVANDFSKNSDYTVKAAYTD